MKKIVFVTPPDARYGFRMAGVEQIVVEAESIEAALRRVAGDRETGITVVDERLLAGVSEERVREIEERSAGVLVVLPKPQETGAGEEDYALRLIRRAVGYHVRLKV